MRGKGSKKAPQSVVQHILASSLTRSNEIQKFVLETCKGIENAELFETKLVENMDFFSLNDQKLNLGWYLKESGHRWLSI